MQSTGKQTLRAGTSSLEMQYYYDQHIGNSVVMLPTGDQGHAV